MPSVICNSQDHVVTVLEALKTRPCPNCKKIGFLNRHGFLRGYNSRDPCKKAIRANRVFCNNRHAANGCGKTFSIWLAETVQRLSLNAQDLWQFLSIAVHAPNKAKAFETLDTSLSPSTAYRIWNRFLRAQSSLRNALSQLCQPPKCDSQLPAESTIEHLKAAFPSQPADKPVPNNPIACYQAKLQTSFF